jgi:predicted PurR-regulated permease PerM
MGTASRQVEAMEIPRWAVGLIIAVALIVGVIGLLGFAVAASRKIADEIKQLIPSLRERRAILREQYVNLGGKPYID